MEVLKKLLGSFIVLVLLAAALGILKIIIGIASFLLKVAIVVVLVLVAAITLSFIWDHTDKSSGRTPRIER